MGGCGPVFQSTNPARERLLLGWDRSRSTTDMCTMSKTAAATEVTLPL